MSGAKVMKQIRDLDRRIIYLIILLSVVIPLVTGLRLPTTVTPEVQRIFDKVESLVGTGKAVLISIDYDPSTQPELQPMTTALTRHCVLRGVPVIGITNVLTGMGLGIDAMTTVAAEYNATNGEDWSFLGFQTPPVVVMLGIGEDIKSVYPSDYYGTPSSEIPMLQRITNYDDIGLLVSIAGNTMPKAWVTYAGTRYNVPVATGVTAVSATDFYPYLQTGQFLGMMGGIKGAAEYEKLLDELDRKLGTYEPRMEGFDAATRLKYENDRYRARRAMNPQSVAHIVIIAFILLGNITYFLFDRKEKKRG
ncbi:hypothetical protein JW905_16545 [bacterium]|nr:hypothetical protein [candidate division CSSED10-310 bacterium]